MRFDRSYATFYWSVIVNIALFAPFARYSELLGVECRCGRQKSQFGYGIDDWWSEISVDVRLPHISDSRRILAT